MIDRRSVFKTFAALGVALGLPEASRVEALTPIEDSDPRFEVQSIDEVAIGSHVTGLCELGHLDKDGTFIPVRAGRTRFTCVTVTPTTTLWRGENTETGRIGSGVVTHHRITVDGSLPPMCVPLGASSMIYDGIDVVIASPEFRVTT